MISKERDFKTNPSEPEELELRDYLEVIIKRKWLIIFGVLSCLVLAILVTFLRPQNYEAEAVFRNASIEDKAVIPAPEVPELFKSQEVLEIAREKINLAPAELVKSVSVENIKDTNLFKIKAGSPKKGEAVKIVNSLLEGFFTANRQKIEKRLELIKEELNQYVKEIEELTPLIQELSKKIQVPQNFSTDALLKYSILNETYQERKTRLEKARLEAKRLKNKLAEFYDFKVVKEPIETSPSLKKKIIKNSLIGGVVGLLIFVYLAFFLEYWEKSNR